MISLCKTTFLSTFLYFYCCGILVGQTIIPDKVVPFDQLVIAVIPDDNIGLNPNGAYKIKGYASVSLNKKIRVGVNGWTALSSDPQFGEVTYFGNASLLVNNLLIENKKLVKAKSSILPGDGTKEIGEAEFNIPQYMNIDLLEVEIEAGYILENNATPIPGTKKFKVTLFEAKKPDDVTMFLFDLSGSMNEQASNSNVSKLQQAKDASKLTIELLKINNTLGLVSDVAVLGFSGSCVPDPTILISNFETNLSLVENRIDAMTAAGGTPLAEAIASAECKLASHLTSIKVNKGKLVVLSDGQASCQQIRPAGTYNSGTVGQKIITVSANQCGNSNFNVKYYTIGFNIVAGSPAERDLQYLSQISGGKYLNVQSQTQLERAFKKFNRAYIPKPSPTSINLPSTSISKFDDGVNQINAESFSSALKSCEDFIKLHPEDCNGAYNLALMQEANDFYKNAISNYQKYLSLCPNASDKEFVEKQITFLEEEFRQFLLFQKEVVKSDLEYLKLHFEKIQNGQSVALAEEFKGFLKEKGDYYKNLPELMGKNSDRLFKKNCQEVASGLDNCAKTINRNPSTWDRDATPSLSMTYLNLERLLEGF